MRKKQIIAAAIAAAAASGAYAQLQGPSSSQTAHVNPTAPGWSSLSLITVGDAADNGYKMVGIPDGLGAYDNGNGTFSVLMNHELGVTAGIARAHGTTGAFVSEWVIRKSDFRVLSGSDLITRAKLWYADGNQFVDATTSFARFCSADLPLVSAFHNGSSGKGTLERIYMTGEETGAGGRAFGVVATGANKGTAWELPHLGNFSWENSVANPFSGDKTVVVGTDDSTPGQVYLYVGDKRAAGSEVERAGLVGGKLFGLKVTDGGANYGGAAVALENNGAINGKFVSALKFNDGNAASRSGADLQADSVAKGITEFARPEDGAWSLDGKTFYFVTTGATVAGQRQSSKLYRLDFNGNYSAGDIKLVIDSSSMTGTDGELARSFDNMTVADDGTVVIQEDPGGNNYIAKTWIVDPATGKFVQVLESDRERFLSGAPKFLTVDEESSGVIEITSVLDKKDGKRYFLGDMQAHYANGTELVEGGQLYITAVPEPETYALMLSGLGLVGFIARRRRARG